MDRLASPFPLLLVAAVLVAGCAGASAPGASPPPSPAGTSATTVDSPEEAAQLVLAQDPRFEGFGPQDPELIGQCCWYAVEETPQGYEVVVHAGWGDCPAGCINEHEWGFLVSRTGEVRLVGETGDPVPPEGFGGDGAEG